MGSWTAIKEVLAAAPPIILNCAAAKKEPEGWSRKMIRPTSFIRQAERLVNRNPLLYGPGPVSRHASGIGSMPPLKGLVVCAGQGLVVALAGGLFYNVFFGDPMLKQVEAYYEENPPR